MTPTRRHSGGYRPPRSRREVIVAVLGVLVVALFTVAAVWVLKPDTGGVTPGGNSTIFSPTTTVPTTPTPTTVAGG